MTSLCWHLPLYEISLSYHSFLVGFPIAYNYVLQVDTRVIMVCASKLRQSQEYLAFYFNRLKGTSSVVYEGESPSKYSLLKVLFKKRTDLIWHDKIANLLSKQVRTVSNAGRRATLSIIYLISTTSQFLESFPSSIHRCNAIRKYQSHFSA